MTTINGPLALLSTVGREQMLGNVVWFGWKLWLMMIPLN